MNRRELLKVLAIFPLAAFVPSALQLRQEDLIGTTPERAVMNLPRPVGYSEMRAFRMSGFANENTLVIVDISRDSNQTLLRFQFNAYGGYLDYTPRPGEEIIFLGDSLPKVAFIRGTDEFVDWYVPLATQKGPAVLMKSGFHYLEGSV